MAEQLGEAVLVLRTDDAQLAPGMAKAEAGAKNVGAAFDKTSASADRLSVELGTAGGAAAVAGAQIEKTSGAAVAASGALQRTSGAAAGASASFRKASTEIVTASGAQRAGTTQLIQNIGDMTTMYNLGARPAQIFASQIGQVTQAIQLMAGGTSKFASFLAGPFGIAVLLAVQVLGPFIGKLFETASAADDTKKSLSELAEHADPLAGAADLVGRAFDRATGKLKTMNAATLEAIKLQAQLAIQMSRQNMDAARTAVRGAPADRAVGVAAAIQGMAMGLRIPVGNVSPDLAAALATGASIAAPTGPLTVNRGSGRARDVVERFLKGSLDVTAARAAIAGLAKSGDLDSIAAAKIDRGLVDYGLAAASVDDNMAALQSIEKGVMDPRFRIDGKDTEKKDKKAPADRSAEIADRQAGDLAQLDREELQARLDLTTDIFARADIQQQLLGQERDERIRQVEANRDLSRAQKDAQIAYLKRLYGDPKAGGAGDDIEVLSNASPYAQKIMRDMREREAALANDALTRQADALSAQAGITTNLHQRHDLEQRALELQQQIERNLLDQDVANGRIKDADQARALLADKQRAAREQLLRSEARPLRQLRDQIDATGQNMDVAIEGIEVQGLERLNDGLADAILGAKSLGDVFHDVAGQIISDLLRIAIQQEVIKPLASMLWPDSFGGGSGGTSGLFSTIANGFSSVFGGGRAVGGPIEAGTAYLVGERGPELVVPRAAGSVIPNGALAAMGGGSTAVTVEIVDTTGLFETRVSRISGAQVRAGLAGYDRVVADRVKDQLARRG